MQEFEVIYEGRVVETYIVSAESAEEAAKNFYGGWLAQSEVVDVEVVNVEAIEEEEED